MRLEEYDDPPLAGQGTQGRDRGRDLGRMVRIVVDEVNAARLAVLLEAAAGAAKPGQRLRRRTPLETRQLERRQRAGGVQAVVLAGDGQLDVGRL